MGLSNPTLWLCSSTKSVTCLCSSCCNDPPSAVIITRFELEMMEKFGAQPSEQTCTSAPLSTRCLHSHNSKVSTLRRSMTSHMQVRAVSLIQVQEVRIKRIPHFSQEVRPFSPDNHEQCDLSCGICHFLRHWSHAVHSGSEMQELSCTWPFALGPWLFFFTVLAREQARIVLFFSDQNLGQVPCGFFCFHCVRA